MRKGKRRAINTVGEISKVFEKSAHEKRYEIEIKKIHDKNPLCRLVCDHEIGDKMERIIYLVLFPWRAELERENFEKDVYTLLRLENEELEGAQRHMYFQSIQGKYPIRSMELWLDNRGRARQISREEIYYFTLIDKKKEFFERYERGAIPPRLSKGKRSEPDMVSEKRIRSFIDMSEKWSADIVLDVAAGVKDYIKKLIERNFFVICANISFSSLKSVRDSFSEKNLAFLVYDADKRLPFKENSFNYVICDAVLEYLLDPVSFIRQISDLLPYGGEMLLLEPIRSKVKDDFYPQDMWELALWRPLYDPHFNFEIVQENLKKSGFEVIERRELEFSYSIYDEEFFRQSISRCLKMD